MRGRATSQIFLNQQAREQILQWKDVSSEKRSFILDTPHSANFVKMLDSRAM